MAKEKVGNLLDEVSKEDVGIVDSVPQVTITEEVQSISDDSDFIKELVCRYANLNFEVHSNHIESMGGNMHHIPDRLTINLTLSVSQEEYQRFNRIIQHSRGHNGGF